MSLVAIGGATIAGGVFNPVQQLTRPTVAGIPVCLVGDTATCSAHESPQVTSILPSGSLLRVQGIEIAHVGSPTTCGHAIITPGPNTVLQDTTV